MKAIRFFSCVCLLSAMFVACSDDSVSKSDADGGAGSAGSAGTDGKMPSKDAGSSESAEHIDKSKWTKGSAEPCDIKSGFDGDDLCIKAPDPKIGFQLHYGPSNYDDMDEVAKYVLMPNQEVTDCIFTTTPNATEIFHNEYHGRMRPGSHHLLVYTEDATQGTGGDSDGPQACNQGVTSRNIFGAQTPTIDLLASGSGAPEDKGLAQRLPAKQRAVLQMHFINTTDHPILREGWTNVIYVDKSKVTHEADPIFFLAGVAANIQPGTTHISKGQAVAMTSLRLVEATGHYHAHTVRFSAWKTIAGKRDLLFEDFDWHEPSMFNFNTVTKNTASDAKTGQKGAYSGIVQLEPGDMIDWECEVVNDGSKALRFGNEVYGAEMCNMFGAYTPGADKPWSATNL